MRPERRLRVATYNVHKCRGLDGRVRPGRIVEVAREIDPDILALQEVLCVDGDDPEMAQARYLGDALGVHTRMGEVRRLRGGTYGNLVLSRFPLAGGGVHDLSVPGCEPRGVLRVDAEVAPGERLHVFNVHLGTAFLERRLQAPRLLEVLRDRDLAGPRVVLGDFNEWTRGLVSQLVGRELTSVDRRREPRRSRTYPGVLPLMYLDHIYFGERLELLDFHVHRSRTALVASDHLPLVAEFRLLDAQEAAAPRLDAEEDRGERGGRVRRLAPHFLRKRLSKAERARSRSD